MPAAKPHRTEILAMRLTPAERKRVERAAKRAKMPASAYARELVIEYAGSFIYHPVLRPLPGHSARQES